MLASAWKLVSETLYDLVELGVTDGTIKSQIRNNGVIRARYLVLYDLVNILVSMGQARFSVLATTTRESKKKLFTQLPPDAFVFYKLITLVTSRKPNYPIQPRTGLSLIGLNSEKLVSLF